MRSPVAVGAAVQNAAPAPDLVPSAESTGALVADPALESAEAVAAAPAEELTAAPADAPPEPPSAPSAVDQVGTDKPESAPPAAAETTEEATSEGQATKPSPDQP